MLLLYLFLCLLPLNLYQSIVFLHDSSKVWLHMITLSVVSKRETMKELFLSCIMMVFLTKKKMDRSIRKSLRYPAHCHGFFGLLMPPPFFIEPQPLQEEQSWCCALLPPPPHLPPREGSRVSNHQGLCVYAQLFSRRKSHPPAQSTLQRVGGGSRHRSLGHNPGPVCLSVCLPVGSSLSVSSCHLADVSVLPQSLQSGARWGHETRSRTHRSVLASTC